MMGWVISIYRAVNTFCTARFGVRKKGSVGIQGIVRRVRVSVVAVLTFWRRNYFFNFSTFCLQNVNNTGTKQLRIMKQTAF